MQNVRRRYIFSIIVGAGLLAGWWAWPVADDAPSGSWIVQGRTLPATAALVASVGGEITHELGIIHAVGAQLTAREVKALENMPGIERLVENRAVAIAAKPGRETESPHPYTEYPTRVGADLLHAEGITGYGVTLAVLDTGYAPEEPLVLNTEMRYRIVRTYDATRDKEGPGAKTFDTNGHGTHVSGISLNSALASAVGKYNGIAPDAGLVVVKAFDADGRGTYADVIRGLDWIVANRDRYGIRVLNLSFSAPPQSYYWDDPLNQAVMRAWQAGVVVVAAAGNLGPAAMSIGVPGNVPYVITVGAMTDQYTPGDRTDDRLASFSAAGPTAEGFVKPEVTAPGGHMLSLMTCYARLVSEHGNFFDGALYFTMSGTSQSTAVVSGVALLLLEADPSLTPAEVKCRLMAAARPAVDEAGNLAYSPFQQGAGLVDAPGAVRSTATGCANRGLDVDKDVAGIEHYIGPARLGDDGVFYIEGVGYEWDGTYLDTGGTPWVDAAVRTGGTPWVDAAVRTGGTPWVDAGVWSQDLSAAVAINVWVDQE